MKHRKLILAALALCLLLTACSKKPAGDQNPSAPVIDTEETLYHTYYTYHLLENGDAELLHYYGMEETCEVPAYVEKNEKSETADV